ncbi:transposase IS4 [Nitzschia inconspicua]|uniref:Transposase IS4 n=1 Tax=Nitzschia inconspicua TaxID=303405 RepID=A0A9K3LYB7_9STRA|nr:transposase IS4 [Nitzschia inconspicua]KAG7344698.1 transposase IS4 [Nitzschia inconspicua]KAG7370404.1 transposase IS4 [Nitzschia inconspicua]
MMLEGKGYKDITDYCLEDRRNFLMMTWVDSDVVDMVSTIYEGYETLTKERKRTRENQLTRRSVRAVWESADHTVVIDIPQCIDDYNICMGGVDKAYQLMSGLKSRLRCRRTWMPIMVT